MPDPSPELLPTRSLYAADAPVLVEVRGLPCAPGSSVRLVVRHLGDVVAEHPVTGVTALGRLEPGGYSVALEVHGATLARTAVQVVADPSAARAVLRYGFVTDYAPDRDLAALADNIRRLHLTAIQFYDWAYRHADLMGGGEAYADPLGNPVWLPAVRAMVQCCHEVGADALGYAAVYGVGADEWPVWERIGLREASGAAYGLGDFLRLVDPAQPQWLAHLGAGLRAAADGVGFDGFHLDQYGYPKHALGPGGVVDVADSFVATIRWLRDRVPQRRLVFNNVNDFPTWATASTAQDAVYVEVWDPNTTYADLARIATRARAAGAGKPVCLAAYLHVYDQVADGLPVEQADHAAAFTMAAVWSHGATHLLAGEADRILVDPYYVRNHVVAASTAALLRRWYDFLVAHHDLLLPSSVTDVTAAYAGDHNGDLDVSFGSGVAVAADAVAGSVWRRITSTPHGLVVHLVNLVGQPDTFWDGPHTPPGDAGAGTVRVRRVTAGQPEVLVADPDGSGWLQPVAVHVEGPRATAILPPLQTWQVVLVRSR